MLLKDEILQGRYRIVSQLGQGGMSTVYEAQDQKRFDAPVALKEILIDLNAVIGDKEQEILKLAFKREAKILAEVQHEAFPHVIEYFSESGKQYLVMELVEGANLAELLANRKTPFSLEEIMKWSDELLDALDYLHSHVPPIFQSDLKPQNLKLNSRGKIKLLDFGIAKSVEEYIKTTTTNQTFIAAPHNYLPFEQILRVLDPTLGEVITQKYEKKTKRFLEYTPDARSDLYALCATLYHLSTAVVPTDALKRILEVWANKTDSLRDPHELNPDIPEEISLVFLKAMAIEPGNRFASATEMKQALIEAVGQIKRRQKETAKKLEEEVQHTTWLAEQKRLEQERFHLEQKEKKREEQCRTDGLQQYGIEVKQDTPSVLIEPQLQEPEIQGLDAVQERLRVEAEQIWVEQEHKFAEQAPLQFKAESAGLHQYEDVIQQLIAKQPGSEPEKQLSKKENPDETETTANTLFEDDLTRQTPAGNSIESPKQLVSSDILSDETANLPFTYQQNHKKSWFLPVTGLIFLMFGVVILGGVLFLQTANMDKSNDANPSQTEPKQTESNQIISPSYTSDSEATVEANPEIPEASSSTLLPQPINAPGNRPTSVSRPVTQRMKKPTPKLRKTPPIRRNLSRLTIF